ncbi:MAG: hypothetical protein BZ138_02120 [Methanosphaera sp. rholeuAM270]|nr:MAG: hypothetical protein BZ138_02120 [Methanosphaera sp. rholeuAM270]
MQFQSLNPINQKKITILFTFFIYAVKQLFNLYFLNHNLIFKQVLFVPNSFSSSKAYKMDSMPIFYKNTSKTNVHLL